MSDRDSHKKVPAEGGTIPNTIGKAGQYIQNRKQNRGELPGALSAGVVHWFYRSLKAAGLGITVNYDRSST